MRTFYQPIRDLALAGSLLLGLPARAQQPPLIETAETVPAADQWLSPGDRLQVRVVGRPGARVTFLKGQPLTELAPNLTKGKRGVYQGTYGAPAPTTATRRSGRFRWRCMSRCAPRAYRASATWAASTSG